MFSFHNCNFFCQEKHEMGVTHRPDISRKFFGQFQLINNHIRFLLAQWNRSRNKSTKQQQSLNLKSRTARFMDTNVIIAQKLRAGNTALSQYNCAILIANVIIFFGNFLQTGFWHFTSKKEKLRIRYLSCSIVASSLQKSPPCLTYLRRSSKPFWPWKKQNISCTGLVKYVFL